MLPRLLALVAAGCLAGQAFAAPWALEGSLRDPVGDAVAADGATLLAVTPNGIRRIDPGTRAVVAEYPVPGAPISSRALAVRNGEIVVGLPGWSNYAEDSHGIVRVIDPTTSSTRLTLASPAAPQNDAFGVSVAIAGDDILVGTSGEQRVYRFDGDTGDLLSTFEDPTLPDPFTTGFGWAVAAVNGIVWIGAPTTGVVHRFDLATGAFLGSITGAYGFGTAVHAVGGDVLVGGADPISLHDGDTGALVRTFANPNPSQSGQFGTALDSDGTVLAVGNAGFGAGYPEPQVGIAYVFELATGAFLATLANPTPAQDTYEDESFGRAVAVVGGRVAVADPGDQQPSSAPGGLYVFDDVSGCGDGAVTGHETCDDGNTTSGDGCDANCRTSACGNGVVAGAESCDDGNLVGGDGCDQNCRPTGCGNGAIAGDESCDDGNLEAGDGCSPRCQLEFCGNGVLDPGETCDDTNAVAGDGCDACQREVRDAFTCYRVRGGRRRAQPMVLTHEDGTHTFGVARPIMFCLGDSVTAPTVELTCYRARQRGATHPTTRLRSLDDSLGAVSVSTGGWRTLCLPSDGARIVRHRHTLVDPTANPFIDGGFGFATAVSNGRIVVTEPGAPSPFQGSQHRFDAGSGAFLGVTNPPWASRYVGCDVTDAGNGEVVIASMDDDAYLLNVTTGAFVRKYSVAGSRTPDDRRQIVAAGPYVLVGDPSNHLAGSFAGAVHVFRRSTGALLTTLTDPAPGAFSGFGHTLATLGSDVLIGNGWSVRRWDPTTWTPTQEYTVAPGSSSGLAATGDRVLIGTQIGSDTVGRAALLDAANGTEIRSLGDPLAGPGDLFGIAATSAAGAFVVGAARASWLVPRAGAVHVFDAANGERLHTILSPNPGAGEWFGRKVAAGGDLLVATRLADGAVYQGEAYVFTRRLLDAYGCRTVRPRAPGTPRVLHTADRFTSAPATVSRLATVCEPVAPEGGTRNDTGLLLTCYDAVEGPSAPRAVTVHNALGTQTLDVRGRRQICVPASTRPAGG